MLTNQEALNKLDAGFDEARSTESMNATDALQLLSRAVRGASVEEDVDVAKARVQRLFCLGSEVLKALDTDDDDLSVVLPSEMLAEVRSDVDGEAASIVPMSTAMDTLAKRFSEPEPEPEPTEKRAEFDESVSAYSAMDLNSESFNPNDVDWGVDPDFN